MAEPESILQLGIEAAREGKKEEARNLFRLLTRQQPGNSQAWLWLAGVAENRDERQGALERVLELEPDNVMAQKGLQALGVTPGASAPVRPMPDREPPPPAPVAPRDDDPFGSDDPFGDDDPFAELDNLSDVMASDTSGPVRRNEPLAADPDYDDDRMSAAAPVGATARNERSAGSPRSSRPSRYDDDDDEYATVPARRGMSPLLLLLLLLVGLGLIAILVALLVPGLFGGDEVAQQPQPAEQTAIANATALAGGPTSEPVADPTTGGVVGVDPTAEQPAPTDPNAAPTAEQPAPTDPNAAPTAEQPAPTDQNVAPTEGQPTTDLAGVDPAIVPANTPLSSEGWLYDFNQPTYAAPIIGSLGQYAPNNGRFVVVLAFIVNNTGQPQQLPADFFVIKDAQGRVWTARPEVSEAYVSPGINADLAQTQTVPPDGLTRSVAIIFDVAPDATDLVFFSRSNPGQGWLVLQAV
ncbi:MAG: hypothetical protein HC822_23470 [Oscillochloris sp.]|nr:hypothetical protein [Oscillochloris sp.]